MLVLTSTEKLQLVLSAGTADVDVNYNDRTATAYGPADSQQTAATAATNDICTAPGASTSREINRVSVTIKTTGGTVTLQKFNSSGSVTTKIWSGTGAVGDNLLDSHADNLKVIDTNFQIKTVMPGYLPLTGGTLTGALIPSQTLGITGTTTNNDANTGAVGEFVSASVVSGSALSLTNNIAKTITSISLTAGDWDVRGVGMFLPAGTTNITTLQWGSSLTTNVLVADDTSGAMYFFGEVPGGGNYRFELPIRRISIASTTTVYLVLQANFSISTMTGAGTISARRVR